ncbi:hypothetical protein IWX92DRAFT_369150 [Phyllosticta citricarpa]
MVSKPIRLHLATTTLMQIQILKHIKAMLTPQAPMLPLVLTAHQIQAYSRICALSTGSVNRRIAIDRKRSSPPASSLEAASDRTDRSSPPSVSSLPRVPRTMQPQPNRQICTSSDPKHCIFTDLPGTGCAPARNARFPMFLDPGASISGASDRASGVASLSSKATSHIHGKGTICGKRAPRNVFIMQGQMLRQKWPMRKARASGAAVFGSDSKLNQTVVGG